MHNHHSLVHRVCKAKYFPKCTFLDTKVGSSPSFVWRSILKARETLRRGLKWKIGDGKMINNWRDKWLPITPVGKQTDVTVVVRDLIDEDRRWWNETQ
jgi:hypothetical protein